MEVDFMSTESLEDVGTCCLPCLGMSVRIKIIEC